MLISLTTSLNAFTVSVCAFVVAMVSLVFTIGGFNLITSILATLLLVGLLIFLIKSYKGIRKVNEDSKKLNEQWQEEYFKLYPERKEKLH